MDLEICFFFKSKTMYYFNTSHLNLLLQHFKLLFTFSMQIITLLFLNMTVQPLAFNTQEPSLSNMHDFK